MAFPLLAILLFTSLLTTTLSKPVCHRRDVIPTLKNYTLTLTHGSYSPDGFTVDGLFINGQSPGPLIELEEGDTAQILVINNMNESATLHFHGIVHGKTPYFDGVPGVTQYPILPGDNYTYTFTVNQYGQYWYHGHYKWQITDGLRAPLIVHPKSSRPRSYDLIPGLTQTDKDQMRSAERRPVILMVADHKRMSSYEVDDIYMRSGIDPICVDSFTINGRGQQICPPLDYLNANAVPIVGPITDKGCIYPNSTILVGPVVNTTVFDTSIALPAFTGCTNSSSPLSVNEVNPEDGWASINIVMAGSLFEKKISIDGHKLWVYSIDGEYVTPQEVDIIFGTIGERYQVMVKLDNPGEWAIRVSNSAIVQLISGYSVLSYSNKSSYSCNGSSDDGLPPTCSSKTFTSPPDSPLSSQSMDYVGRPLNNAITLDPVPLKPYPPSPPPQNADVTMIWNISNPDPRVWVLHGEPFLPWREDSELAYLTPQPYLDDKVAVSIPNGSVVDLIFNIPANNPSHPFHKHDVHAYIIGQGQGPFIWNDVAEAYAANSSLFNLVDPPLRDTFRTPPIPPAWIAIRYETIYPGPVMFHCHIDSHLQTGMAIMLLEGAEVGFPKIPDEFVIRPSTIVTTNPNPTYADGYTVDV